VSDGHCRTRAVAAIFAGAGLSTTGYLMAYTVNTLIAEALQARPSLVGLPGAATVLGTAIGSSLLMRGTGVGASRRSMLIGYIVAAIGAVMAATAVALHQFWLFVACTLVFGIGYGANRIARYSAAALYPPWQRGTVIGWVVWAATIGAVAGPSLLASATRVAESAQVDRLIGPYIGGAIAMALSALVMVAMPIATPYSLGEGAAAAAAAATEPIVSVRDLLAAGDAWFGLIAMLGGQVAMVAVMTMTPLHMAHHGASLSAIGIVISTHTLGMYGLAPLTGRLADRLGPRTVIAIGTALLVGACLVAATLQHHPMAVLAALGLLGLGWNFDFVAGSACLTRAAHSAAQTRLQGIADALVWTTSAMAGLIAGVLLDRVGFPGLSLAGAVIATAPWWVPRPRRRSGADAAVHEPAAVDVDRLPGDVAPGR
jgi:MFS family permease